MLAGCSNPDAGGLPAESAAAPAGARAALARYAQAYMNWSWKTLPSVERRLAGMAVGAAAIADRRAAVQMRGDRTLALARVVNRGRVLAIAPDTQRPGVWVVVTRQWTGGAGEYEGLPAADHVTLARIELKANRWEVREWLPQS